MIERSEFKFEICANSVESCLAAQEAGADRVELCAGIPEGGTTPSYGEIAMARRMLQSTKLHVIIRPRGGDFLYCKLELDRMAIDIDVCQSLGVDGVVFGCLAADGTPDLPALQRLQRHARGMSVTFHRAFDQCSHPMEAMRQIASLGFNRILTSGQQPTADRGVALLKQLQDQASENIAIMAGCGVNERNIASIYRATGIKEYHFSARVSRPSAMQARNTAVSMGSPAVDDHTTSVTSAGRVRATMEALLHSPSSSSCSAE